MWNFRNCGFLYVEFHIPYVKKKTLVTTKSGMYDVIMGHHPGTVARFRGMTSSPNAHTGAHMNT